MRTLPILIECQAYPSPTAGSGTSAVKYLTSAIDRKIMRVATGKQSEFELPDCFMQRALVRYAVHDALESSLFAISHGDLAAQNIIVNSAYNINSVSSSEIVKVWC